MDPQAGVASAGTGRERSVAVHQLLGQAFLMLDDRIRQYLRQYGLTLPEFSVLWHLDDGRSLTLTELSRRTICEKSAMTRIVDRLEARGLVRRERTPGQDRRRIEVHLTPAGRRLRQVAGAAYLAFVAGLYRGLAPEDLAALERLLSRLCASLEVGAAHQAADHLVGMVPGRERG